MDKFNLRREMSTQLPKEQCQALMHTVDEYESGFKEYKKQDLTLLDCLRCEAETLGIKLPTDLEKSIDESQRYFGEVEKRHPYTNHIV